MPTAAFRFEASIKNGGGHASRCLVLANALKNIGWRIYLICNETTLTNFPYLKQNNYFISKKLNSNIAEEIKKKLNEVDLLVIDNYSLDEKYESTCRDWARKILIIDDLANRRHACDFILDQTHNRVPKDYKNLVPKNCKYLMGSKYILLKPEFNLMRQKIYNKNKLYKLKNIFVSFGASDPYGITKKVMLGILKAIPNVNLNVVIGYNDNFERYEKIKNKFTNVKIFKNVPDMSKLMVNADLSFGAAGVTSWERCSLGIPSIIITTAENQNKIAYELDKCGAAKNLGWHSNIYIDKISDVIQQFSTSTSLLKKMSANSFSICDGLGVDRTVKKLLN